jgi:pyruvate formate lyase activating enzyme
MKLNKNLKKIIGYFLGILFIIFLLLLPTILIESTVKSVNLAVKIKREVTQKKTGQPPIAAIEPIEKVGFFHFLPGATAYYLAAVENDFSARPASSTGKSLRPINQVIADAQSAGAKIISLADSNLKIINDYNLALAKAAKENNFRTALSDDSCLDLQTLKNILPYLDAVEINLNDAENNYCPLNSASDLPALQAKISAINASGKHWEVIDILNSSSTTEEINNLLTAVSASADQNAVIHFITADDNPSASTTAVIIAAREQALRAGFKYIYTGGFDYPQGESTYCANGSVALSREDDYLLQNNLTNGKCADEMAVPGVWK